MLPDLCTHSYQNSARHPGRAPRPTAYSAVWPFISVAVSKICVLRNQEPAKVWRGVEEAVKVLDTYSSTLAPVTLVVMMDVCYAAARC